MANTTTYKRQYRELSDETKSRISRSLQGTPKSAQHKQRIAQSLKNYWSHVPNMPKDQQTTIQDIMM